MEITETKNGESLVIGIKGRLDTTNYVELEKKLTDCFDQGSVRIVVNCAEMDYISSSGLRVFLIALKKAALVNGSFVLAGLQETIMEIFEIAGFTTIFAIYGTVEEAIEAGGRSQ